MTGKPQAPTRLSYAKLLLLLWQSLHCHSQNCRLHLLYFERMPKWPAVSKPGKDNIFIMRVEACSPPYLLKFGGGVGYRPRVRKTSILYQFYYHSKQKIYSIILVEGKILARIFNFSMAKPFFH